MAGVFWRKSASNSWRKSFFCRAVQYSFAIAVLAPLGIEMTATPSFASTELGQTQVSYECAASYDFVQVSSQSTNYAAPSAGRLTEWLIGGGLHPGKVQFEVWQPRKGSKYELVYLGKVTLLKANIVNKVKLSPSVQVKAKDVIGLRTVTEGDCSYQSDLSTDVLAHRQGTEPKVGTTYSFVEQIFFKADVAADFT